MSNKKHTISECRKILRSCAMMLDTLYAYNLPIAKIEYQYKLERVLNHLALTEPQSQLTEPWCFERIISLYNEINSEFLKY